MRKNPSNKELITPSKKIKSDEISSGNLIMGGVNGNNSESSSNDEESCKKTKGIRNMH